MIKIHGSDVRLIAIAGLLAPFSSLAQTDSLTDRIFTCSNSSVTRTLKIQYPNGTALPCRVVYDKSQEGSEVQILWQATTEEGYCEDKAETFVTKLTSWGWNCSEGAR